MKGRKRHSRHPVKLWTPFSDLSKTRRREAVIQLKNRIRRDTGMYGGLFTSHVMIEEEGRPDVFCHDADVYFPGAGKFTIWNADISTVTSELWGKAHSMAFDQAWGELTDEDTAEESRMDFIPHSRSPTGKVLSYTLADKPKRHYEQFDGRTFREQVVFLEKDILENNPPEIYECFELDKNYAYGIGLKMVVDEAFISVDAINRAIERFRAGGEVAWKAENPVAADRLPKKTEAEVAEEQRAHYILKGRRVRMDY